MEALSATTADAPAARWRRWLVSPSPFVDALGAANSGAIEAIVRRHLAARMHAPPGGRAGDTERRGAARRDAVRVAEASPLLCRPGGDVAGAGGDREWAALAVQVDARAALAVDQRRIGGLLRRDLLHLLPRSRFEPERLDCVRQAFMHYTRAGRDAGMLALALRGLLAAEGMERTDHVVLHRLGLLHLYVPSLLDLGRAEDCLTGAARFALVATDRNSRQLAVLMHEDGRPGVAAALPENFALRALAADALTHASLAARANRRLRVALDLAQQAHQFDERALAPACQLIRCLAASGRGLDAARELYRLLQRHAAVAGIVAGEDVLLDVPPIQAALHRRGREVGDAGGASAADVAPPNQASARSVPAAARADVAMTPTDAVVSARAAAESAPAALAAPGSVLCHGEGLPAMVIVPAGEFLMGTPAAAPFGGGAERWVAQAETPVHQVRIARPFAAGRWPVTFAEFDRFVRDSGYAHCPGDYGWGRGTQPVIDVNWFDAQAYCDWLARRTGRPYRLLSEAEWEYCARAGTSTAYWWGDAEPDARQANTRFSGCRWSGVSPSPCGQFAANPFGLQDMLGNVEEWCADLWHDSYVGAPDDGSAWLRDPARGTHVPLRGGSWNQASANARCAARDGYDPVLRHATHGFRVALSLGN